MAPGPVEVRPGSAVGAATLEAPTASPTLVPEPTDPHGVPVVSGAERTRGPRRGAGRLVIGAVALAGLGAGGFLAARAVIDNVATTDTDADAVAAPSTTSTMASTTTSTVPTTTTTVPDPADTLAIRVQPDPSAADGSTTADGGPATATIRDDGKLHLEGTFASQDDADAFIAEAALVFGVENIVESYVVDPAAPATRVEDVSLDKPVLFTSGTAEIDPDYIPFLEACAGVLASNPHIVMSISAYTDAAGDDGFNLELSQRRAQAIVDFYRDLDIAEAQLVGTGYGEADPVADNSTPGGRAANRRAMLQLLNVGEGPTGG